MIKKNISFKNPNKYIIKNKKFIWDFKKLYSKINYEHREILLRNRPEKLYQLSPKGTVPVLELPNGDVID